MNPVTAAPSVCAAMHVPAVYNLQHHQWDNLSAVFFTIRIMRLSTIALSNCYECTCSRVGTDMTIGVARTYGPNTQTQLLGSGEIHIGLEFK